METTIEKTFAEMNEREWREVASKLTQKINEIIFNGELGANGFAGINKAVYKEVGILQIKDAAIRLDIIKE